MKKLAVILVALAACFSTQAISISEAYERIAALPGAALSDIPEYDCLKDGMDWGHVVMLMGAAEATCNEVEQITGEITDPLAVDVMAQGTNHVLGYTSKTEEGRTQVLLVMSMSNMGIIAIWAQGGDDVISSLNIN